MKESSRSRRSRPSPCSSIAPRLDKARDALINDGIPYDVECEIRRKSDGAVRVVHSRARWDPVNTRLFGVIRDVTEAKETAAGLKRALAEKETLSGSSTTGPRTTCR